MARKADDERVLVVQEGVVADRTDLRWFQGGTGDAIEGCESRSNSVSNLSLDRRARVV